MCIAPDHIVSERQRAVLPKDGPGISPRPASRIPPIPANRRPGAQYRTPRRRTPRASRHAGRQSDGSLRWAASYPAPRAAAPDPATIQTAEGVGDAEFEARRGHRALRESALGFRDIDRRPAFDDRARATGLGLPVRSHRGAAHRGNRARRRRGSPLRRLLSRAGFALPARADARTSSAGRRNRRFSFRRMADFEKKTPPGDKPLRRLPGKLKPLRPRCAMC